jgi:hypothetical protein
MVLLRVASKGILEDLNKTGGPPREPGGYDRWLKWWTISAGAGIKLEDCTGQPLGTLPGANEDSDEKSEDDEEVNDSEEEEDSPR